MHANPPYPTLDVDFWFCAKSRSETGTDRDAQKRVPEVIQISCMAPPAARQTQTSGSSPSASGVSKLRARGTGPCVDVSRTGGIDSAFYGQEAITEFFRRWAGTFEDYPWEVERLTDLGSGAVLAVLREIGRGKGSGARVDRPLATLYNVIDGKIVRITTFRTEQEALEAAGLSE
jgi:ketosteroid isomerase-like protein